jgi:hypothetical protein
MAIDLKAMRDKLEKLNNKGGKTWKPKLDSKTKARVLAPADGDPFKDIWFHYGVGEKSIVCPKRNYGEACPVCEFATSLFKSGEEENIEMAKDLFAKQRFYTPIVLREDDEPAVKVWGYSQTVYKELLEAVLDPEYGDIADPVAGTDFVIKYEKPNGKMYPHTSLKFARKPSSMVKDYGEEKVAELLKSVPDIRGLFDRVSTAEVQEALDSHLSSANAVAGDTDTDTEKFGAKAEVSDVDSAVAELGDG